MFILKPYSNKSVPAGQPAVGCRWSALSGVLLVTLVLTAIGCSSIYDRARTKLPPDPEAEARLRITEARRAETAVIQAASKLRDHLERGAAMDSLKTDFSRLEQAAGDLERRVLAAGDAAARCPKDILSVAEIERLQRRAEAWVDYSRTSLSTDTTALTQRLHELLQGRIPQ